MGLTHKERRERRDRWAEEDGYDSWKDYESYAADLAGRPVCGAPAKKSDRHADDFPGPGPKKPCGMHPKDGATRCKWHGGASPQGRASPQWKHGRYSKAVPEALLAYITEHRNDPELLSSRTQIAAMHFREEELWEKIEPGESLRAWKTVAKTVERIQDAREGAQEAAQAVQTAESPKARAKAVEARKEASAAFMDTVDAGLSLIAALCGDGIGQAETWQEIMQAQEHARRLKDTERKWWESNEGTVTIEQMNALIALMGRAQLNTLGMVTENEKQLRKAQDTLMREMKRLLGPGTDPNEIVQGE